MRVKTFTTLLLTSVAPLLLALPASARSRPAKAKHAEARPAKHATKAAPKAVKAKGKHRHAEAPDPPVTKRIKGRRAHAKPAPKTLAKAAKPASIEAPEGSQPEIHVTHNRKQHFAPAPESPGVETPRKATSVDFLTPFAVSEPAPVVVADAEQVDDIAPPSLKQRKTAKPARPSAQEIADEQLIPPVVMPALYSKSGRLIIPPAMKGSHDILVHQNVMADSDGLDRIQDDEDLIHMRATKLLVAVPSSGGIQVDERLPENRRYCRPWTARFLVALAKAHYAQFHSPLQVNSAVRTVEFQQRLIRTNGNAAPASGDIASPHLTGQAVDLAKHGLSMAEIAWLRGYLLPLVHEGKVDVEEEFQQACFHISVYKKYLPTLPAKRTVALTRRGELEASAKTAMR